LNRKCADEGQAKTIFFAWYHNNEYARPIDTDKTQQCKRSTDALQHTGNGSVVTIVDTSK